MRTPERVIRPAAEVFLAVVADRPADVLAGREQIIDLAAVIDGDQAPPWYAQQPCAAAVYDTRRQ